MRIAWFTPLPPESAIGTFSRNVGASLARDAEVDLWVQGDGEVQPTSLEVRRYALGSPELDTLGSYDFLVFNFGDYLPYHGAIYDVSRTHRGVAILHDRVMHHLFAHYWLTGLNADERVYLRRVESWYGAGAARRARAGLRGEAPAPWEVDEELARMPLFEEAIVNAEGVIAHSRAHAAEVREQWLGPVAQLDLPTGNDVLERAARPAAPAPPRADGRLRALIVGNVNPNRHAGRLIDMLVADEDLGRRIHVDIVGPEEGYRAYADELRRRAAEHSDVISVVLHGRVGDDELARRLAEADLFINLRYPALEGASASLIEQLAYARPVLVFDTGSFAEIPAAAVARVPPGDFAACAEQLRGLIDDPARRQAIGREARRYAEEHSADRYADGFLAHLDEVRRMRPSLRVLDRAGVEMGRLGITGGLGLADRITEDFAPVLRGALSALGGLRLRMLDDADAPAFRSFMDANDVPAITETFDPFPMRASSADRILAERDKDLYYGVFDADGSMVAMSMLRGWDEGYEVPSFGIVVGHGHQGRGLGSRLTAWTVEQARATGAPAVRLTVYDDNPAARAIYQRLGFAELERRPAGARRQIVMKLELGSV